MSKVINITTHEEFRKAIDSKGNVLIDFWAVWCGPCRMMGPVIEEIADESDITVYKINTDNVDKIVLTEMDIRSIPNICYYADGVKLGNTVGALSKDKILEKFTTKKI